MLFKFIPRRVSPVNPLRDSEILYKVRFTLSMIETAAETSSQKQYRVLDIFGGGRAANSDCP